MEIEFLDTYQALAMETAQFPEGFDLLYPAVGAAGEAGELLEKIKKQWRNNNITEGWKLADETKLELAKEIGDVLWYLAAVSESIGWDLSSIASLNIAKLHDRKARNVIKSEGDNR